MKEQKQPPKGVPRKRCSENMQEIYRRTSMPKCDFNKVENQTSAWMFSCKFAAYTKTLQLAKVFVTCKNYILLSKKNTQM